MEKEDLKALIEEEEKILLFYARYEKKIVKMTSYREWEMGVDASLDILIDLYQRLKG